MRFISIEINWMVVDPPITTTTTEPTNYLIQTCLDQLIFDAQIPNEFWKNTKTEFWNGAWKTLEILRRKKPDLQCRNLQQKYKNIEIFKTQKQYWFGGRNFKTVCSTVKSNDKNNPQKGSTNNWEQEFLKILNWSVYL